MRAVELGLDALPDAPAPRLDDHAAAHGARLGHVAVAHDGLVPLGEVLLAGDGKRALAHRATSSVSAADRTCLGEPAGRSGNGACRADLEDGAAGRARRVFCGFPAQAGPVCAAGSVEPTRVAIPAGPALCAVFKRNSRVVSPVRAIDVCAGCAAPLIARANCRSSPRAKLFSHRRMKPRDRRPRVE